ncbi:uncharacterized protein B0I36DRAFT_317549 [Microdochium trichocladiopsis]|uniref:N-acetyltransferase domain-containing protein n=1 Tax=Microdochium trichocladiopsis TaxID=1682393 RepID=A0A9P8YDJ0_9PEZI|nr:uncharacterized protein B0I36DRAFT_317549 [Microdochium trichocladiopsis]KAH7035073.1 hypothetical protein B0I36DRAFT_317549 [Microdochium trichocladiopsis]
MHQVQVSPTPPPNLLRLLEQHLPHSLPLLRRLQFTRFPGGITEHTRILFASGDDSHGGGAGAAIDPTAPFAAAYVDFSRGPETEVWMYSSLESRGSEIASPEIRTYCTTATTTADAATPEAQRQTEVDLAIAVLRETKAQLDAYTAAGWKREREVVLLGTFSEKLREAVVAAASSPPMAFPDVELYDKWLMRLEGLPDIPDDKVLGSVSGQGKESGETLHWTQVRREDIAMVLSRTSIPRKERTIVLLPSIALAKEDGTLVAWAFLGPDSSLTSLHCEPEYRGRGLAKAVAVKIFREHLGRYGDDGYCFADVAPENKASQGVCKSLGAKAAWRHSWARMDLDKSFPDMQKEQSGI